MIEPDTPTGWHLKKEVQISHIISSIVITISVVLYLATIERRIAIIENQMVSQHEKEAAQDRALADSLNLVRDDIRELSRKIDRVMVLNNGSH